MRFRFIEDRRADYPVTLLCDVLGVSPAGYYAWRSRPESRRSAANRDLVDDIRRVHRDTRGRYGSPRIRVELMQSAGLRASMSRKGDCYDNARMESFFHTLKTELVHRRHYATRAEATRDIFAYIEGFYNRTRRHSAIGYISPIEMELKAA